MSHNIYDALSAPAYSNAEASRLTRLTRWRVARWMQGYRYAGKEYRPVIRREGDGQSPYVSFLDLIDMLFVRRFVERGFSIPHLRKALKEAREYLGTPHFARNTFFTSSEKIILQMPQDGSMVALLTGGQQAIRDLVKQVFPKLDFEDVTEHGFVNRWYPDGRDGHILIDPLICFGRPTIKGRSIATENVYDLYRGENERVEPVQQWFGLPVPEIQAAIRFEAALAR